MTADSTRRTVVLNAAADGFGVVFEMMGHTIEIPPFGHLRFELTGPESAVFTIGWGANGVSVFRDEDLMVTVYDESGAELTIPDF